MAWLYLLVAACFDVVWVTLMKLYGFMGKPLVTAVIIILIITAPLCVNQALKTLPLGTSYAFFVGFAAVLLTLVGIIFFREPATLPRLFFIGLIIAGIVGLKLVEDGGVR